MKTYLFKSDFGLRKVKASNILEAKRVIMEKIPFYKWVFVEIDARNKYKLIKTVE